MKPVMTVFLALALSLSSAPAGPSQALQFQRGAKLAEFSLNVDGKVVRSGVKSSGTKHFILNVSGTLTTPGGRAADGLYLYQNPYQHESQPLPHFSPYLMYMPSGDNIYRRLPFFREAQLKPAFSPGHSYDVVLLPEPDPDMGFAIPPTYWDFPRDKPKDTLSGSLQVAIYEAIEVKTDPDMLLDVMDGQGKLNSNPPSKLRFPNLKALSPLDVRVLTTTPLNALRGAAADGVSLVLLRVRTAKAGKTTFHIDGAGGLYWLDQDAFRGPGTKALTVSSLPLPAGEPTAPHWSFVVYRPPKYFGDGDQPKALKLKAIFSSTDGKLKREKSIELEIVRPPVVLVHGTYDNPKNCWQVNSEVIEGKEIFWPKSMEQALRENGFQQVFCVDWEKTNGSGNPSDFATNQETVKINPKGIDEALSALRGQGYACTQADLVCHSQGGIISRVFAKGAHPDEERPASHPHHHDPRACGCSYHHFSTFGFGHIHSLITISTTHRGSDICRLLDAYMTFKDANWSAVSIWTSIFLGYVHYQEQGIYTGGFRDQVPGNPRLRKVGATPVPAHAIAAVSEPQDLFQANNLYLNRLTKIWRYTTKTTFIEAFKLMGQPEDGVALAELKDQESIFDAGPERNPERLAHLERLRVAAFGNDENDCTVAKLSSLGGLAEGAAFTTVARNVLHGYAPRSPYIQERVLAVLRGGPNWLCETGFPDSYTGEAGTWVLPDSDPSSSSRPAPKRTAVGAPLKPRTTTTSGPPAKSLEEARAKAEANPDDADARTEFARALFQSGQLSEAMTEAKAALRLNKQSVAARLILAGSFAKEGSHAKAEAHYREALLLDYRNPSIHAGLGSSLLAQKNWNAAERSLREAVRLAPKNGQARADRALALYRLNRVPEAKQEALEAKRLGLKTHPIFAALRIRP